MNDAEVTTQGNRSTSACEDVLFAVQAAITSSTANDVAMAGGLRGVEITRCGKRRRATLGAVSGRGHALDPCVAGHRRDALRRSTAASPSTRRDRMDSGPGRTLGADAILGLAVALADIFHICAGWVLLVSPCAVGRDVAAGVVRVRAPVVPAP